jgi:hypothetical protein
MLQIIIVATTLIPTLLGLERKPPIEAAHWRHLYPTEARRSSPLASRPSPRQEHRAIAIALGALQVYGRERVARLSYLRIINIVLGELLVTGVALIAIGALYVHIRCRRAPRAYWAMIALAGCYFIAGGLLGAWAVHFIASSKLHRLVCSGKISLADAQKCIASNWIECWEKYVVPEYGPQWAALNRHGW